MQRVSDGDEAKRRNKGKRRLTAGGLDVEVGTVGIYLGQVGRVDENDLIV